MSRTHGCRGSGAKVSTTVMAFAVFALAAGHLEAQTWLQLAPAGPLPGGRTVNNSTVLDTTSNRMIVFGGSAGGIPNLQ